MNYSKAHSKSYRPEIDGLRALAVVSVIFFHAGFGLFSGGFVGVDVFFVISGYLITSVILQDLEKGEFSIVTFYRRRARRILPVLFFVMLTTIPFAWLFLAASDFKNFSGSLVSTTFFGSNIFFWQTAGYFDTETDLKPLIHTWSLAVEEQYYLLFPPFLFLSWKLGKLKILIGFGILFLISIGFAYWATPLHPTFSFYSLSTRGWELLLGVFSAFYLFGVKRREKNLFISEFGGWLGVGLIAFSVIKFNEETPNPSLYSLVPVIGALVVILFAAPHNSVGKLLGSRLFVGIGLLSYSAYLWHQPIFAFSRYIGGSEPSKMVFIALSGLTMLLSYFSWRYIENVFRDDLYLRGKVLITLSILLVFLFSTLGLSGYVKAGFPAEIKPSALEESNVINRNFILLGDSHANHLIGGIRKITSGRVEDLSSDGCIPFRNVDRYDSRYIPGACARLVNNHLNRIVIEDPDAMIVLSSMGPVYLDGVAFKGKDPGRVTGLGVELISDLSIKDPYKVFEIGFRQTLSELSKLSKSKVIFALDVPELGINNGCNSGIKEVQFGKLLIKDMVSKIAPDKCFVLRTDYDNRVVRYKALVLSVLEDFPKILYFDPTNSFCSQIICKGHDSEYGYLYKDVDHLSDSGSLFYARSLLKSLAEYD